MDGKWVELSLVDSSVVWRGVAGLYLWRALLSPTLFLFSAAVGPRFFTTIRIGRNGLCDNGNGSGVAWHGMTCWPTACSLPSLPSVLRGLFVSDGYLLGWPAGWCIGGYIKG